MSYFWDFFRVAVKEKAAKDATSFGGINFYELL